MELEVKYRIPDKDGKMPDKWETRVFDTEQNRSEDGIVVEIKFHQQSQTVDCITTRPRKPN